MRRVVSSILLFFLPLALFAACTTTPTATPATPRWDKVAIECRILIVPNNFFDGIGFDGWGNSLPIPPANGLCVEPLDNFRVNMLLRATQADTSSLTYDLPRLTLLSGAAGTLISSEQQGFVSNPLNDLNLSMDLQVRETPEHQHAVTLKRIYPTRATSPAGTPHITVPEGLPLQFIASDQAIIAILGMHDTLPAPPARHVILLLRFKGIVQKEIENELFGPGYDRPTSLPASRNSD